MFKLLVAVFCAILYSGVSSVPLNNQDISGNVWSSAEKHATTDLQKLELSRIRRSIDFDRFSSPAFFFNPGAKDGDDELTVTCTACKAAMETVKFFLKENYTEKELISFLFTICMDMKIMPEDVCTGFTKNVGPEIVAVLNMTTASPTEVCSFLLVGSCGDVSFPSNDWEVQLPTVPKPPLQSPNYPPEGTKTLRVLHISDTHIDLKYAEGSYAECDAPLCCRNVSGPGGEDVPRAGHWGGWKCDTPIWALDNWLEHAAATHKDLDYIIWTGDLPSHDIWDQTQDSMLEILKLTASKIRQAFPDIPVYPAIGNHDSAPVNSFPPPEIGGAWNMSWLYDEMWNEWGSHWLDSNETAGTLRKGAFYSVLARPGLRIISLNMNFCYTNNWWLVINSTDPSQELAWLSEELQKAENAGEKVHILGHVPPGRSDCMNTWSLQFVKIITRYESTVAAQFFGHTHKDEFQVFYDLADPKRPVSHSFIGPSITTYTDLNPGYRVYDVDGDRVGSTRLVLDHETWIYDLDEANRIGEPQWKLSYRFKDAYGFKTLLPSDFHNLYEKLKTDEELMNQYHKFTQKESPLAGKCDEKCASGHLCGIRSCGIYSD